MPVYALSIRVLHKYIAIGNTHADKMYTWYVYCEIYTSNVILRVAFLQKKARARRKKKKNATSLRQ